MHVLLGLLGLSRHHRSPQSPVKSTPLPWCVALQGCAGLGWDFTATSGASDCFLGATGGLCTAPVTPWADVHGLQAVRCCPLAPWVSPPCAEQGDGVHGSSWWRREPAVGLGSSQALV